MTRFAAALERLRTLDDLAARDSALARLDPRAKLGATLLFLVTLMSCGRHDLPRVLALAPFAGAMAWAAALPARLWLGTLAIAAPLVLLTAGLDPWLDPVPVTAPWPGGPEIGRGWLSLATTSVRLALTVTAVLALVASTGLPALCGALSRLGVPEVLAAQLLLMHRYTFVLVDEGRRLHTAWQLRSGGPAPAGPGVWAAMCGQWLQRSLDRAGRVHQAMLARGYEGRLPAVPAQRWRAADTLLVMACAAAFAAIRLGT